MEYLMIDKGSENDESVCDIGYYVQIPMSDTDGGNQYVIEGFVDGEYPCKCRVRNRQQKIKIIKIL